VPLVANSELPSFARLRAEGEEVIDRQRAARQDIRELHIGLLNMMPDAALQVTERQFMRLVGACNRIAQFHVHPFSIPGIARGAQMRAHIDRYYLTFEDVVRDGLDALIVTGAIPGASIVAEPFWEPLGEVFDWAATHVTSTLCACLATHAAMKHFHGIDRQRLPAKRWGVYPHRVTSRHPLVRGANTRFDVPHSRFNEIYRWQMEAAGVEVLVESEAAGVHLAVSGDGLRFVYFQGHPEYDRNSLLKEYKREVGRCLRGEIEEYPRYPENYLDDQAIALLDRFRERATAERGDPDRLLSEFPEREVLEHADNTWGDSAKIVFNNWLGAVYKVTSHDRREPFMAGIDPDDPLGRR
jgi:homoserine O-succinyltransferase